MSTLKANFFMFDWRAKIPPPHTVSWRFGGVDGIYYYGDAVIEWKCREGVAGLR